MRAHAIRITVSAVAVAAMLVTLSGVSGAPKGHATKCHKVPHTSLCKPNL